jgi:hypothetical protein
MGGEIMSKGDRSVNVGGANFGFINTGDLYARKPQRQLTDELKQELLQKLPKEKLVSVEWIVNDAEAHNLAMAIRAFLKEYGYNLDTPAALMAAWAVKPIELHHAPDKTTLIIGSNN